MQHKILVIEDEKRMAQLLYLELMHEGYTVEMAFNGKDGVAKMQQDSFSAILLDYMLPEMNGSEVCREVRKFSSIPILALTARDDIMEEVRAAGASLCLRKPFEIEKVLVFLRKSIGNSHSKSNR